MKYIQLTKGKTASVCDCHYDLVKGYKWQYHKNGYAVSAFYDEQGKHHILRMHRIINNTPRGFDTDHVNGYKLNNHCKNLRTATRSQNMLNAKIYRTNRSGVKGVTWDNTNKMWVAQFHRNNQTKNLGRYSSIEAAQEALYAYSSNIAV